MFSVVGQDHAEPSTSLDTETETFPQWGIAVLVIGLAAIAFVVIFGVSMVGGAPRRMCVRHCFT